MPDGGGARFDFQELATQLRPRLHRYCARMIGSPFDGEDLVQDTLARASEALAKGEVVERPEGWLFRIAHNVSLDAIRRRNRRGEVEALDDDRLADDGQAADARVAATASFAAFLPLSASQRSSVILVDVLGYDLAEVVDLVGMTLPAVKAALHRGRVRLKRGAAQPPAHQSPDPAEHRRLMAYAERFNARDFDALRDLLVEEARLDLVNRVQLAGKGAVSVYFARYDQATDWRVAVGTAEGLPALVYSDPAGGGLTHVALLVWRDNAIAFIRDFKYAPYVMEGMQVETL